MVRDWPTLWVSWAKVWESHLLRLLSLVICLVKEFISPIWSPNLPTTVSPTNQQILVSCYSARSPWEAWTKNFTLTTMPICFLQASTQQKDWARTLQKVENTSTTAKYLFLAVKASPLAFPTYLFYNIVIFALQRIYSLRCGSDQEQVPFQNEIQL